MKRCFIYSAGSFYGTVLSPEPEDSVIASDAGYLLCKELGIVPDLLIGDFDSMEEPETFTKTIRVPVEKDDTDTMLAIRKALESGAEEIHIYGGTGGKRLDHTLANIQSLAFIRRHGAHGYLYDKNFVWTVIENETLTIRKSIENGLVSVFALESKAEEVSLSGLQYPLDKATLTPAFPVGVSNHITCETARITAGRGLLLVGWEVA